MIGLALCLIIFSALLKGGMQMMLSLKSSVFLFLFFRFLEDQVKSQKSPQVEEVEGATAMGKEAKHGGNAVILQRLINEICRPLSVQKYV